ncbi:MAG TPA: hypothetical protein VL832_02690 [Puia sp.]|nr:hypothetical protein [Puia sp.]
MKFDNQLRYANTIITSYHGEIPLHAWLKNFFREHKQMGSKDRRLVSNMVYGFYRLGHAVKDLPADERVLLGLFLCNETPGELLAYFRPAWNEGIALPLEEKIILCREAGIDFQPADIFPWKEQLSEGIDHAAFCLSFLKQPDLFLRIRPGHEQAVLDKLAEAVPAPAGPAMKDSAGRVTFEFIPPFTLRLPNGFKVEEWFTPDREVVIQDYSSQRIAPFLQRWAAVSGSRSLPASESAAAPGSSAAPSLSAAPGSSTATGSSTTPGSAAVPFSFWDACAASGGKSILAFDLNPGIDITVSDIRESILHNLRERFRRAGIKSYHSFVADLTAPRPAGRSSSVLRQSGPFPYDLILADVPCSGSGTWSRTPEELYFFDPKKIDYYRDIQKKIVTAILPRLANGASLVYSTCSVFKKENEEMVTFIRETSALQPERMESIKGYDQQADSMFAARFIA